jgi:hypothetical protein
MTPMTRRILSAFLFATALALGTAAGPGAASAGCLSQAEVLAAVQNSQALKLSSFLGQIRAAVPGGEIQGIPALCDYGGRLVYQVNVLSGGQVTRVTVDAQTGAISY